ncbi:MAG TPA: Ppx/GppA phosphatase family protein [Planctomycetota bacterium]|nr:Ppx/GppA phosphatase family protein [Planctomycetota bacterium]
MKVAAIDIGANSVHLVVSRLHAPGVRDILDRSKEMLLLGRSTFGQGSIPKAELDRAIAVLKRYRAIAESQGVEAVLAVATSAVREAKNREQFVERAQKEARLAVRVLSGEEEGRLIYAGVRDGLPPSYRRIAVIDIGGGSAEIVVGEGPTVALVQSLKLGVLRLVAKFPGRRPKTFRAMEEYIRTEIGPVAREVAQAEVDSALGTSGTIMTLASILGVRDEGRPIYHHMLVEASARLISESPKDLAKLPAVGKDRAETIGPGALVLRVFMEEAGLREIIPCERALREGVVADYASRHAERLEVHDEEITDPRRRSVYFLARRVGTLDLHAHQTARLALRLFDGLTGLHRLPHEDRELLEYAALLHDAGYWIGAEKHHKHAFYLIREGPLEGFSREEIQVIALVARYHRGALPKEGHSGMEKLSKGERRRVRALAALLRIADGLDRSHAALVKELNVTTNGGTVSLELVSPGDLDLELYAAGRRGELFMKEFDRELRFKVKKSQAP